MELCPELDGLRIHWFIILALLFPTTVVDGFDVNSSHETGFGKIFGRYPALGRPGWPGSVRKRVLDTSGYFFHHLERSGAVSGPKNLQKPSKTSKFQDFRSKNLKKFTEGFGQIWRISEKLGPDSPNFGGFRYSQQFYIPSVYSLGPKLVFVLGIFWKKYFFD